MKQEPNETFELDKNGFDILHYPRDADPCVLKNGACHNINHLHPISQSHRNNPNGLAAVIAAIDAGKGK